MLEEFDKNVIKRKAQLYEIEQSLPQKNSMYLKVNTNGRQSQRKCVLHDSLRRLF